MSFYIDRLQEINRLQNQAIALHASIAAVATAAAICGLAALSFTIGRALPATESPAAAYSVVEIHGTESDIVDYDVSLSDCLAIVEFSRASGRTMTCESAR